MSRYKITGIFLAFLALGVLNALISGWFSDLKFGVLLACSLFRAGIFFVLTCGIWFTAKYGNFGTLKTLQKVLNCIFLGAFTLSVWLSAAYAFDRLCFPSTVAEEFLHLLPLYILFGIMFYVIVIQYFIIKNNDIQKENENLPTAKNENPSPLPPSPCAAVERIERIAVRQNAKIHVLPVEEVFFLSSEGDYVLIYTENTKYLKEQTMKYFEQHLPDGFLRVHRSTIVNVDKISRIELFEKQSYYLILKNSRKIKMSPQGYRRLRTHLGM